MAKSTKSDITPSQKKEILDALSKFDKLINEAIDNDCEVDLNGNGTNCYEAYNTFVAIDKKIRAILK